MNTIFTQYQIPLNSTEVMKNSDKFEIPGTCTMMLCIVLCDKHATNFHINSRPKNLSTCPKIGSNLEGGAGAFHQT